jgi:outer membrane protein assembly factor BamA
MTTCNKLNGQTVSLKLNTTNGIDVNKILTLKTTFASKSICEKYLQQIPTLLKAKGYITASIDSVIERENIIEAFLFVGELYTWKNLIVPNEIKLLVTTSNNDFTTLPETILNYYENNGYPFAKIRFDSAVIDDKNEISATLHIDKGIEYKIDSIRVFGNANISNLFLQHYLKIFNGSLYSKEKLERISQLINQLGYLYTTKNWDILMLTRGCIINLYLQPKNINRFDAIVGFLPNNQQTDGKLLLTVDAKLSLFNAFAKGEKIAVNWQQIQPQSPRIDIGFNKPYIFNSDAGLDFNFNLYKRDSAFLNIGTDIGLNYILSNKTSFKIFVSSISTRLIQPDTSYITASKKLPGILDLGITNLGIEYFYNNTKGSRLNKLNGFEIKVSASFGQKKIKQNTTITSLKTGGFNYASLYDSVSTNAYQLKCKIATAKYVRLGKQTVLKMAANYGLIQTKNYLQNELFQIGGFKLLRGFDEENIFTSQYIIGSLEYRYLIVENSYFFAFTDGGYTQNLNIAKNYKYFGTGVGLALETKQGILNISFAAGKRNDLPFNLRETKIHIGIISGF